MARRKTHAGQRAKTVLQMWKFLVANDLTISIDLRFFGREVLFGKRTKGVRIPM